MWDIVVATGIVITLITAVPVFLQLRKHPQGIHILFFTEMWERFSYYGMRVILLTYMTQHFLFQDELGQGTYGAYTSLVYLLPLIGGFLADKIMGTRKAVAFGALLLVAGHLMMAVEQPPVTQTLTYQGQTYEFGSSGRQDQRQTWLIYDGQRVEYGPAEGGGIQFENLPASAALPSVLPTACAEGATDTANCYQLGVAGRNPIFVNIFFLAMSLIVMGVGFLKANISTSIGQLYEPGDPRRDAGFTLYYFGINMGAFWAQVLCAGLAARYGWAWGFGLAGIGMLYGWLVFTNKRFLWFIPGPKQLPDHLGVSPNPELLAKPLLGPINREWLIYIGAILAVGLVWLFVQREAWVNTALGYASIVMLAYFFWYLMQHDGGTKGVLKGLPSLAALLLLFGGVYGAINAISNMQGTTEVSFYGVDPLLLAGVGLIGAAALTLLVVPNGAKGIMAFLAVSFATGIAYWLGLPALSLAFSDFPSGIGAMFGHPAAPYAIGAVLLTVALGISIVRMLSVVTQRVVLALVLVAASTVFFALFELAGSALNQFAERNTQLPSDGFFTVTSGQTQSFNGAFILLLAPVFAIMWSWLGKHKLDPGDGFKFALGLIQVGAGFLVLVWGAQYADEAARVPLIFLVLLYLLHTTAELFLSPVGLSAMTKLAPAAVVSTMMATWFLASSVAQALAAQIAKMTAQETVGGQVLDPHAALATYAQVFNQIGWVSIWIGVGMAVASPLLRYMAHQNVIDPAKPSTKGAAAG